MSLIGSFQANSQEPADEQPLFVPQILITGSKTVLVSMEVKKTTKSAGSVTSRDQPIKYLVTFLPPDGVISMIIADSRRPLPPPPSLTSLSKIAKKVFSPPKESKSLAFSTKC